MYIFFVLFILLFNMGVIVEINEYTDTYAPFSAKLMRGIFLVCASIGVRFLADQIGWRESFDYQLPTTLFLAAPLFVLGLWNIVGRYRIWQMRKSTIHNVEGILVVHLIASAVLMFVFS